MEKKLDELLVKYPLIFAVKRKYPFYFECGDGWYHIIDRLCANAQSHINTSRGQRARALRFNRAMRRVRAGAPIEALARVLGVNGRITDFTITWAKEELARGQFKPVPEAVPQLVATQVKEKFGTLRFYYDGGDDEISGMVRMAEAMSGVT